MIKLTYARFITESLAISTTAYRVLQKIINCLGIGVVVGIVNGVSK